MRQRGDAVDGRQLRGQRGERLVVCAQQRADLRLERPEEAGLADVRDHARPFIFRVLHGDERVLLKEARAGGQGLRGEDAVADGLVDEADLVAVGVGRRLHRVWTAATVYVPTRPEVPGRRPLRRDLRVQQEPTGRWGTRTPPLRRCPRRHKSLNFEQPSS